jgi:DtxR family Mn-dependent transcriptional regulator
MQVTDTIQDYLKTIYSIARAGEGVHTTAIAERLGVSPASVTSMVKRLSAMGYIDYHRYQGVELTESGAKIALEVIRHHRLLEAYLHQSMGIPWDQVHQEAEVLEHALSEKLEDAIARILGDPTHDPHGDPIPPKSGSYQEARHDTLEKAEPGPARVERVSDRDPEVLRHLAKIGLQPGTEIVIERKDPYGGPIWVKIGKRRHAVGTELTTKVYVSKVEQS